MLRKGDRGTLVKRLQGLLNKCHFPAGVEDGIFGSITEDAVRGLEAHHRLPVTGIADEAVIKVMERVLSSAGSAQPREATGKFQEVIALQVGLPRNPLDTRFSKAVRMIMTCDGGQGCRYGGWINPYQFDQDEFDKVKQFPIPLVGNIRSEAPLHQPIHGWTCSPFAGFFMAWAYCINQDYNFRIGRSARWLETWTANHKEKGMVIPGLGDYTQVEGKLALETQPLGSLYGMWDWLNKINIVEMSHHIILILKIGGDDGLWLEDPLTPGKPCSPGLYRFAADGFYPKHDGKKYYSGTQHTFRRLTSTEVCKQAWDVFRVSDLDPEKCCPVDGPFAGRDPWPLVLE